MNSWLRQHWFASRDACTGLRRIPGSFLLNIMAVAIALSLPFAGLTALENLRPVSEQLSIEPEISLFLTANTPRDQAMALAPAIRRVLQESKNNGKIEFIAREKALGQLKANSGQMNALHTLGINPLPDAYILRLANFDNATDAMRVETIAAQLKRLPGVDQVQVDSAWVKRLAALLYILRLTLLLLAAALGAVVIAIVFNTIRLQVMTQREEIEVSQLVGATDAFIYRPFYYAGAVLGAAAGGLALGLVALVLQPVNSAIFEFSRLYGADFRLAPLGLALSLLLLAVSTLLGLVGSLLSVRQHLQRIR
jgi:cell division transport system permease protein